MPFEGLSEKLNGVFQKLRSRGRLTETDVRAAMREIRMALLEADVNFKVAKDFIAKVTERAVGTEILESLTPPFPIERIEELTALMGGSQSRVRMANSPPTVVMFVGLQGAGKTTNAAKLAGYYKKRENKRPLLCACDVYRPAAINQLKVVGKQLDIPVFEQGQGDPVAIAQAAYAHAKQHGNDLLIIDTAGRLHIDEALMDELRAIKAQVKPNETLLVIDSMTGQDAVNVAQSFDSGLGVDGVILTKLDGDTRGGAALSVKAATGKPIKFAGVGEKIGDLEPFYPERMASRILGFGDVMTLIEKASTQMDQESAAATAKRIKEGQLDFNDLLEQMGQMKKMGSLASILEMIPGMGGKITEEDAQQGEQQMRRTEAIIQSMTPAEREKPSLLNPSRKRRIAAGSGTRVEDVNRLIRQLADTQKMMKQFTGGKGKRRRGRMPFGGGMPGLPM